MRKLYIPLMNHMSTEETRAAYVEELRRAKADRVFIAPHRAYEDCAAEDETMRLLGENIAFYENEGFEVGVWINGLGHGAVLSHDAPRVYPDWLHIRGLSTNGMADDSFCPLDDRLVENFRRELGKVVRAGAKLIMIDDDLRLGNHGPCVIGCACAEHMKLYNARAKAAGLLAESEEITREELAGKVFVGGKNPWRDLWLSLQGDTMRDFLKKLRAAVDEVDPTVRLGHCACLDTWDLDGIDSIEMSRILAGNTKPFLRLIGAPYWNNSHAFGTSGLGTIVDLERMQLAWCEKVAPELEVFTEGDLYPRPRTITPFLYAEDFDQVLLAEEKADAILKYMLDYSQKPDFEKGYIDRHVRFEALREEIGRAFEGKETAGVWVYENIRKIPTLDCDGRTESDLMNSIVPASVRFSNAVSLPTAFEKTPCTPAALVFGENARYIEGTGDMPLILDAVAAEILDAAGEDVGLYKAEKMSAPSAEVFPDGVTIPLGAVWGGNSANGAAAFRRFTLRPNAEILSRFADGSPAAYRYENKEGRRFLVYAFDAERVLSSSALFNNYPHQTQLFDAYAWLTGAELPVRAEKEPGLYVLSRKDESPMTVGLWNFGPDKAHAR
ncbi:MAG: hypothetical protein MJ141_03690 [Clostridia bacterium]|nr:hypothetical protein [Clostridia bacterium]